MKVALSQSAISEEALRVQLLRTELVYAEGQLFHAAGTIKAMAAERHAQQLQNQALTRELQAAQVLIPAAWSCKACN